MFLHTNVPVIADTSSAQGNSKGDLCAEGWSRNESRWKTKISEAAGRLYAGWLCALFFFSLIIPLWVQPIVENKFALLSFFLLFPCLFIIRLDYELSETRTVLFFQELFFSCDVPQYDSLHLTALKITLKREILSQSNKSDYVISSFGLCPPPAEMFDQIFTVYRFCLEYSWCLPDSNLWVKSSGSLSSSKIQLFSSCSKWCLWHTPLYLCCLLALVSMWGADRENKNLTKGTH